jgi:hypothetical protein
VANFDEIVDALVAAGWTESMSLRLAILAIRSGVRAGGAARSGHGHRRDDRTQ